MSRKSIRRWCRRLVLLLSGAILAVILLQLSAHRVPSFSPGYPQADLTGLLEKDRRSDADYALLLAQTGLGRPAVDALLHTDPQAVLARQRSFFAPRKIVCEMLIPPFMREDHMADPQTRAPLYGPLPTALRDGDLLLTLDTHALGWRHGHAGIVVDAKNGVVLEAVGMGTSSILRPLEHWQEYRSYFVFRYAGSHELAQAAAEYAQAHLVGRPYALFSGLWGDKFALPDQISAQCAYLVWYAYMAQGVDLDSDGGRLVSVNDLAHAPQLELVELYGTDPAHWA